VDFSLLRAGRPVVATGTLALLTSLVAAPLASAAPAAQDAAAAQAPAGQPATAGQAAAGQPAAGQPAKNYKDRGEYDLYDKVTKTQDPKARLELLNTWQDKYPQTDFAQERLVYFVATLGQLAPSDPAARQKLLDKCNELLKTDPKNFRAMYLITVWGPAVGGATPSADITSQVDTAAHGVIDNIDSAFGAAQKPANLSDADFAKARGQAIAMAHNALAWQANTKKDTATTESEYKASLEANPDQGTVSAAYAKLLIDEKKYPEGLYEYARAAQYTGPGPAVPAATRTQLLDYFNKAYKDFHGSAEGADQILAQSKTNALPPGPLNITSQADTANKQADDINRRIASDPQFKLWYAIKSSLTGDQSQQFFNSNVKDAEIPGGAEGVKNFTGTVISVDPPDRPTKVVLGVEDPAKPDATLEFSAALPASALEKVKIGSKLDFSGVADSFNKDPYMVTFKDPTVPGVQTAAPARKPTAARRRR
jgi:hypothetical protein